MQFVERSKGRFINLVVYRICVLIGFMLLIMGCQNPSDKEKMKEDPFVVAETKVEAGKYLINIGGCNDCHTKGYIQKEGKIPEEKRLLGTKIGWRGPWGTTYANNLRLSVQKYSEDKWVELLNTKEFAKLPMPWFNLNHISNRDARAIYAYLDSLGPAGEQVPASLPPGKEPKTPYISMKPQNLPDAPTDTTVPK